MPTSIWNMDNFTSDHRAYREAWNAIKDGHEALMDELIAKNASLARELDKKFRELNTQNRVMADLKRKFEKVDISLKENRYIVILIDAEALPFTEDYLLRPGGGKLAAGDLIHEARKMACEKLGSSERSLQYLPVHVYVFGDLESGKVRGELSVREMRGFVGGFNRFDDTVNWIDLGGGLDGEEVRGVCDGKIENLTRFHIHNPNCVLLILGINEDDQRTHNWIGSSSVVRNNDNLQRILLIGEKGVDLNLPYDRPQVSQNLFRIKQQRVTRPILSKWQIMAQKPRPGVDIAADDGGSASYKRDSGYGDTYEPPPGSPPHSRATTTGVKGSRLREFLERERSASRQTDSDSNHGSGQFELSTDSKLKSQTRQPQHEKPKHPPIVPKPTDEDFEQFKLLKPNPCKENYLNVQHGCRKTVCVYSHDYTLSPQQHHVLRFYAQLTRCKFGDDCGREDCYNGHACGNATERLVEDGQKRYNCKRQNCPFLEEEHPPGCIIASPGYRAAKYIEPAVEAIDLDYDGNNNHNNNLGEEGEGRAGSSRMARGLISRLRGNVRGRGGFVWGKGRKYFPESSTWGLGEDIDDDEKNEENDEREQEDDGWGIKESKKISDDFPPWNPSPEEASNETPPMMGPTTAKDRDAEKESDAASLEYSGEGEEGEKAAGKGKAERRKVNGGAIEEDLLD